MHDKHPLVNDPPRPFRHRSMSELDEKDKAYFGKWLSKRYDPLDTDGMDYTRDDMWAAFYMGIVYENDRIAREELCFSGSHEEHFGASGMPAGTSLPPSTSPPTGAGTRRPTTSPSSSP